MKKLDNRRGETFVAALGPTAQVAPDPPLPLFFLANTAAQVFFLSPDSSTLLKKVSVDALGKDKEGKVGFKADWAVVRGLVERTRVKKEPMTTWSFEVFGGGKKMSAVKPDEDGVSGSVLSTWKICKIAGLFSFLLLSEYLYIRRRPGCANSFSFK